MDLSSHGLIDQTRLRFHSGNLGELFLMQISAAIIEKPVYPNEIWLILSHKWCLCLCFQGQLLGYTLFESVNMYIYSQYAN